MTFQEREQLVQRISSKFLICRIGNEKYRLYSPRSESLYLASELHDEMLKEAFYEGAISNDVILDIMMKNGLWTVEQASELETMRKNLDNFKLELFNSSFKSNAVSKLRKAIKVTYDRISSLENIKGTFDHLSAEGIASLAKATFLILSNLRSFDNKDLGFSDGILHEKIITYCSSKSIIDSQYRELARSEPWNSIYNAGHTGRDIFGSSANELTLEQRVLLFWSKVYRSIYECYDCPHQSIIEDDWMLDGWLIKQAREREARQKTKSAEESLGLTDRIAACKEIFVPVDTLDDAQKLSESMNNAEARSIKRQRDQAIQEKGTVREQDLPDVRLNLQMQYTKLFAEKMSQISKSS